MTDKDLALRIVRKLVRTVNRGVLLRLSEDWGGNDLTVGWEASGRTLREFESSHTHIPGESCATERDLMESLDSLLNDLLSKSGDPDYQLVENRQQD